MQQVASTTYAALVEEYRDLLRQGSLVFQQCGACGHKHNFPRVFCASCHQRQLTWRVSSGRGKIYTYSIIHRAPTEEWAARTPYIIGLVDLDEGVRVMGHIESDLDVITCDSGVVAAIHVLDDIPLLTFTLS